uniref:Galectin n=1 Tax=Heterorhabditis bacteriophora TaxID=37862 RepID=A0A1I7WP03_HETBA
MSLMRVYLWTIDRLWKQNEHYIFITFYSAASDKRCPQVSVIVSYNIYIYVYTYIHIFIVRYRVGRDDAHWKYARTTELQLRLSLPEYRHGDELHVQLHIEGNGIIVPNSMVVCMQVRLILFQFSTTNKSTTYSKIIKRHW